MIKSALVALATSVAGAAAAQSAPPPPADPKAPVAAVPYRSAFENYHPLREVEARSWREANEEVGSLEGHKGHLESPKKPAEDKPTAGGHAGHHK